MRFERWMVLAAACAAALAACKGQGGGQESARRGGQPPASAQGGPKPAGLGPGTAQGGAGPATAQRDKSDLRAQPGEARPKQDTVIVGRVVRATENEVVLHREGGAPELRLALGPNTPVTKGGARSSASELKEGAEVRAAYTIAEDGKPTATRIEVGGTR